jgi:hypothetical protein
MPDKSNLREERFILVHGLEGSVHRCLDRTLWEEVEEEEIVQNPHGRQETESEEGTGDLV